MAPKPAPIIFSYERFESFLLPVYMAFGSGACHEVSCSGPFDLVALAKSLAPFIIRSEFSVLGGDADFRRDRFLFKLRSGASSSEIAKPGTTNATTATNGPRYVTPIDPTTIHRREPRSAKANEPQSEEASGTNETSSTELTSQPTDPSIYQLRGDDPQGLFCLYMAKASKPPMDVFLSWLNGEQNHELNEFEQREFKANALKRIEASKLFQKIAFQIREGLPQYDFQKHGFQIHSYGNPILIARWGTFTRRSLGLVIVNNYFLPMEPEAAKALVQQLGTTRKITLKGLATILGGLEHTTDGYDTGYLIQVQIDESNLLELSNKKHEPDIREEASSQNPPDWAQTTKAEWRNRLYKIYPQSKIAPAASRCRPEEFMQRMGKPSRTQTVGDSTYWYYECQDGSIQIVMYSQYLNLQNVMVMQAINDY